MEEYGDLDFSDQESLYDKYLQKPEKISLIPFGRHLKKRFRNLNRII